MDNVGDGVPMDETPSNTSLLSFDLGSGLTPKMSWLASRTRDGLGPNALQRQGSGGESLGSFLHVTPTVSMRCQQCYARDPHAAMTAFAVCGAFVPRAAAPPRRFFAEPAP